MAITLGSVVLSDAEVTDGIGLGDVEAAARLWVRHWPTALDAARRYVEADEVPGLAAEALVGTIAAIAVGRGPREDLSSFVTAAVAELGESDEPPHRGSVPVPEVFLSPLMTRAFAGLPAEDQDILWLTTTAEESDPVIAGALDVPLAMAVEARIGALTALQRDYLAEHTEQADGAPCHQAHGAMAAAVTRGVRLAGSTWVHMSECAWCTEAFHELAFSNVALDALVDRTAHPVPLSAPVVAPVVAPLVAPVSPLAAEVPAAADVPVEPLLEELPPVPLEPELAPPRAHAAAFSPVSMLRGRRTRIAAGALLAAAAVTAAVLLVTGLDDTEGTLTAARSEQTQADTTELPEVFDSVAPPVVDDVPMPTPTTPAPRPTTTPATGSAATPTAPAPVSTPAPTPASSATSTPKPTPKPSSTPSPSPTPTTAAPTPTPTAPACNPLAHFLGFC